MYVILIPNCFPFPSSFLNNISSPGNFISDEEEFAALLNEPCFKGLVKVGKRGVPKIDLMTKGVEKDNLKKTLTFFIFN